MFAGCNDPPDEPFIKRTLQPIDAASTADADPGKQPATDTSRGGEAIGDEEARRWSQRWVDAVIRGDAATVRALVDWTAVFERSIDNLVFNPAMRTGFLDGVAGAVDQLAAGLSDDLGESGTYALIRIARRGGQPHAIFRLISDSGALNYHDIPLRKSEGKVVGDELFLASTGEAYSDTLRQSVGPRFRARQSISGKLTGRAERELDLLEKRSEINTAIAEGDPASALRIYRSLPPAMQRDKVIMLSRINATPVDDKAAYTAAVTQYIEAHPEDRSVGLIALDAAVMTDDAAMLIRSHASLTRWVGGDPVLDAMVAAHLALMGDIDRAQSMIADVDLGDHPIADVHNYALTIALAADDHDETLKRMRVLRDRFGWELRRLDGVEGFEAFVESPQYQSWLTDFERP